MRDVVRCNNRTSKIRGNLQKRRVAERCVEIPNCYVVVDVVVVVGTTACTVDNTDFAVRLSELVVLASMQLPPARWGG